MAKVYQMIYTRVTNNRDEIQRTRKRGVPVESNPHVCVSDMESLLYVLTVVNKDVKPMLLKVVVPAARLLDDEWRATCLL